MGAVSGAIGDLVVTFMWVFCSSTIGLMTSLVGSYLGIELQGIGGMLVTTFILFCLLFMFGFIASALGGACFNPIDLAAAYAAGMGKETLFSMALRFPAQAAGAVGGALAIVEVMPIQYKHMIGGPTLKVDLHTGAMAEGILAFVINFGVLVILLRGPKNPILKNWLLAMSIVAVIVAGSSYTGPSLNPANAYGWAYLNNLHNTWDQFYVYWICPFAGAIVAAWIFRFVFPIPSRAPSKKKKKA